MGFCERTGTARVHIQLLAGDPGRCLASLSIPLLRAVSTKQNTSVDVEGRQTTIFGEIGGKEQP